jgi:hypothetical protein
MLQPREHHPGEPVEDDPETGGADQEAAQPDWDPRHVLGMDREIIREAHGLVVFNDLGPDGDEKEKEGAQNPRQHLSE